VAFRKFAAVIAAAIALSGCVSILEGAYDDQARSQCEQERPSDRGGCLDRVDENRRDN
jgi:uncharacterized protein YceK